MLAVIPQVIPVQAVAPSPSAGELALPDFSAITLGGIDGRTLLLFGFVICAAGAAFALAMFGVATILASTEAA